MKNKAESSHSHSWDNITSKPSTFTPSEHNHDGVYSKLSHNHTWDSITSKPSTYTPASHNHNDLYYTETEITNLLKNYSPLTVFTTEDIGENIEVTYPENTLICVYEEV